MKKFKHFFVSIFKSPVLLIFVLVCIFMLPTSINTQSVAFRSAIAIAVGVDINEQNMVELLVAINVSSTSESLAENSKILSATGETVGNAFTNLNMMFGRNVRLGHVRFVMIGERASNQNIVDLLDRLVRTSKIRNTVQLIYCPNSLTDIFNAGTKIKGSTGIKLSDIICHVQDTSTTSINSNIDTFYRGYFCPSGISKLNMVYLSDTYTQGISVTPDVGNSSDSSGGEAGEGGETGEGGTSQPEQEPNKYIANHGQLAIYEKGVLKTVLSTNMSNGVNWLSPEYNPKDLIVEVQNAKHINSGSINFDILRKSVNIESFFYKNIPFISAKIVITLDIDEVITGGEENFDVTYDVIDDSVKSSIGKTIRGQISNALAESKSLRLDLFEFNNIFYKNNYQDYKKYLEMGNTIYDVIENTQVVANIEIKIV